MSTYLIGSTAMYLEQLYITWVVTTDRQNFSNWGPEKKICHINKMWLSERTPFWSLALIAQLVSPEPEWSRPHCVNQSLSLPWLQWNRSGRWESSTLGHTHFCEEEMREGGVGWRGAVPPVWAKWRGFRDRQWEERRRGVSNVASACSDHCSVTVWVALWKASPTRSHLHSPHCSPSIRWQSMTL